MTRLPPCLCFHELQQPRHLLVLLGGCGTHGWVYIMVDPPVAAAAADVDVVSHGASRQSRQQLPAPAEDLSLSPCLSLSITRDTADKTSHN